MLYTLAEMENVRTIARRDMDTSKQFAIQSFAKQLLDVADNLSRALESVPADALKEENALLGTLVEGVRMTDQQLQKVFGANKIVKVRSRSRHRRPFCPAALLPSLESPPACICLSAHALATQHAATTTTLQYGAPGDKFDPNVHDALFEYEDAGREAGSVGQVLKTGYKLHDRVIRPAQVGTVKKAA